ncbi:imidazole glycerol phosphate synthase subunit HisF [Rhodospirillaceae bacterium KN72]|uniref:Imidazole glycerol phosphate synthase subunit HisF n=1 Tax=Pacificispira spongiicola TaxID=2729598 RepID=A0A7Y0HF61_9PROT|nr:HisA/HisF-related TIM barrel protein [Pacificispira spongiicola]NMM45576.1 imidazole glycerol phosphate synthase subunit HisF [Pacificispira spongiicola]
MTTSANTVGRRVRVIPRLDIKGPNVVKGICFDGQRALGLPKDFAETYSAAGADEIILYDTFASLLHRPAGLSVIAEVADRISVPLTVAGGLRTIDEIRKVLRAGADKVAINTAALHDPDLLRQASEVFGTQCIVASVEYHQQFGGRREIRSEYGREPHPMDAEDWIGSVLEKGVGEIMITAIDRDGLGLGADLDFVRRLQRYVPVPLIVGGGVGTVEHFVDAAQAGADAVAAASVFHYAQWAPIDKKYLQWDEKSLRIGAPVDAGNIDFLNGGYGGFRDVPVTPCHLSDVKAALSAAGIGTRLVNSGAAA